MRTLAYRLRWTQHGTRERKRGIFRKAVKTAGKNLEKVRKTAVLSFFWAHVRKLEASVWECDHAGFYRRLKTMNLEGK